MERGVRTGSLSAVIDGIHRARIPASTESEIERRVCERLAESSLYASAWVGTYDAESEVVVPETAAGPAADSFDEISLDGDAAPQKLLRRAIRTRGVTVERNLGEEAPDRERRTDAFDACERETLFESGEDVAYGLATIEPSTGTKVEPQRNRLDTITERITDSFYALDEDWRFIYLNEQSARVHGADSREELIGEVVWEAFPEAAETSYYEKYHEAMETQEPVVHEDYFEPFDMWIQVRLSPSESGLSVYHKDVTEREERERRLQQQNERLESFASMLAHELRNPLSIAQIYLQDSQNDERAFEEVETALDRMEEMIDILLVLTRGGDTVIDPEPVALDEMATKAWSDVSAPADRLRIGTDLVLAAEPHHLRHMLENLFRNALEHGDDVTVRVGTLEGTTDGFYVEDAGTGIPESARDRIFEAGYTTDATGIGLGLTFIGQLGDAYGWEYEMTRSDEGGARFAFRSVDVADED